MFLFKNFLSCRGVRENYREAMYIGLTMFFTVCIFALWILGGFLSPASYGDVCLASGLVAAAAITFVIMFMPKGRQLSAMGRDGLYTEDRAEVRFAKNNYLGNELNYFSSRCMARALVVPARAAAPRARGALAELPAPPSSPSSRGSFTTTTTGTG